MNLWLIIFGSWLGSWTLTAILYFTWFALSRRLLERRYKQENDRSRNTKEFGNRIARGENEGSSLQGQGFNPATTGDIADTTGWIQDAIPTPTASTTSTTSTTKTSSPEIRPVYKPLPLSYNERRWSGK